MGLFPFFVGVVIAGEYTHWRSFWKFEMYQRGSYWYSCPRKVGNFWVQQTRGEEGVVMITLFFFPFCRIVPFLVFLIPLLVHFELNLCIFSSFFDLVLWWVSFLFFLLLKCFLFSPFVFFGYLVCLVWTLNGLFLAEN